MSSGVFDRVAAIFEAVCDLPVEDRAARLDELCAGDERIRRAVVAMLNADERSGEFLRTPALGGAVDLSSISRLADATEVDAPIPERIGPFTIKGVLGRGGMGVVYRARQTTPTRDVALKVIAPGLVNTATLRRFELEIQTLARLSHPGVAQVYDAGVFEQDGRSRPWFAMELVEGERIDAFCTSHTIVTDARLRLFLRVCDAVEHAHVKGVVHRDLKPANVLVDASGQPKVLDFGVARALDTDAGATLRTETGQIVGTLAYMSPEQVRGDATSVDTRSDVYSLGVIVFEMLTGALPHDVRKTSIAEAARRICSEPPRRLVDVSRAFRGDLDTIVRTALEQDADRRYQSAGALAREIRRYLDNEPIVAHPPSAVYTLRKFAARHRATSAAIVVAAVSLLAGAAVSVTLAVRATRAEHIAEAERDAARIESARAGAVNEFLNDMLASADPDVTLGRDLTINEVLDDAAARMVDAFTDQPEIEARVRRTVAGAYRNLGRPELARENLDRAIELLTAAGDTASEDMLYARSGRALTLLDEGRVHDAIPEMRAVLADAERILGADHDATLRSRNNLAFALTSLDILDEAEPMFLAVRDARLRTVGADDPEAMRAELNLLRVWMDQGRLDAVEPALLDISQRMERVLPEKHSLRVSSLALQAWVAGRRGDTELSLQRRQAAVALAEEVLGPSHSTTLRQTAFLAWDMTLAGDAEGALPLARRAFEGLRESTGPDSVETLDAMNTLGVALFRVGQSVESRALHEQQLEIALRVLSPTHRVALDAQTNLGVYAFRENDFTAAEQYFRAVYDARLDTLGADNRLTGEARANLVTVAQRRAPTIEDPGERTNYIRERLPMVLDVMAATPLRTVIMREQYIFALHESGDHEAAVAQGQELLELLLEGVPPTHERVIACRSGLARCLEETGDHAQARAMLQDAHEAAVVTFGPDDQRTVEIGQRLSEF